MVIGSAPVEGRVEQGSIQGKDALSPPFELRPERVGRQLGLGGVDQLERGRHSLQNPTMGLPVSHLVHRPQTLRGIDEVLQRLLERRHIEGPLQGDPPRHVVEGRIR